MAGGGIYVACGGVRNLRTEYSVEGGCTGPWNAYSQISHCPYMAYALSQIT